MSIRHLLLALALAGTAGTAQAGQGCEDLKAAINARILAKGVRGHSLDIVGAADVGTAKIVGECENGRKRIVYARGNGTVQTPAARAPQAAAPAAAKATRPAPSAKPVKPAAAPPALGNY